MILYKRPKRYVHLVAPGLPQRVTEVHDTSHMLSVTTTIVIVITRGCACTHKDSVISL